MRSLVDESVMKITHHISASLVLGSLLVVASPVFAGDEIGVELIELPGDSIDYASLYFSDDGELRLIQRFTSESRIWRKDGESWELIRRDLSLEGNFTLPSGLSGDGSVYGIYGIRQFELIDGSTTVLMPEYWYATQTHNGHDSWLPVFGRVSGGDVSHDGKVVTLSGRGSDRSNSDSLIWTGGSELINISDGLPTDDVSYEAGVPNGDGTVVAFSSNDFSTEREIWVWQDGTLINIPTLHTDSTGNRCIRAVADDGHAVFGNEYGPLRGAISSEPISAASDWAFPHSVQTTAWMWTESAGTTEIIDRTRFLTTNITGIDANGTMALVRARRLQCNFSERYLWFGDDKFVLVDEVLHALNITIDADWYSLYEVSFDGTKLMGAAIIDGRQYGLVVTIPDLTP